MIGNYLYVILNPTRLNSSKCNKYHVTFDALCYEYYLTLTLNVLFSVDYLVGMITNRIRTFHRCRLFMIEYRESKRKKRNVLTHLYEFQLYFKQKEEEKYWH